MPKQLTDQKAIEAIKNDGVGNVYIKVTLPGDLGGFIDELEHAKAIIDELVKNAKEYDQLDSYEFSAVIMTEKEFNELPDFSGF